MRAICPHVAISPETRAALDATGRAWEPRDTSASPYAYWELLAGLWAAVEPFIVVEHDIVPSAQVLDSLEACPADWCSAPYPYLRGLYAGLGCAKFTAPLMARHPDLMAVVATMSDETHEPKHWCRLDAWMRLVLTRRGEQQCHDHPEAGHLGTAPSHGCVT